MLETIYRYGNEFDRNVIYDKMNDLDDKIEEEQNEQASKERNDRVRELIYAKFVQGLKLCTGYTYF